MGQRGETLVEVLIAVVLLGAISSAYFATAATQTGASAVNRELVQADTVARNYAELAKAVVRRGCSGTFTVDTSDPTAFPPNFQIATSPSSLVCPSSTVPQTIALTVTTPQNALVKLSFTVLAS
jgi:prepilin-type N-terminal cleavage/methylation domain-containing protein